MHGQNKPSTERKTHGQQGLAVLEVTFRGIGRGGAWVGKWWGKGWFFLADLCRNTEKV